MGSEAAAAQSPPPLAIGSEAAEIQEKKDKREEREPGGRSGETAGWDIHMSEWGPSRGSVVDRESAWERAIVKSASRITCQRSFQPSVGSARKQNDPVLFVAPADPLPVDWQKASNSSKITNLVPAARQ